MHQIRFDLWFYRRKWFLQVPNDFFHFKWLIGKTIRNRVSRSPNFNQHFNDVSTRQSISDCSQLAFIFSRIFSMSLEFPLTVIADVANKIFASSREETSVDLHFDLERHEIRAQPFLPRKVPSFAGPSESEVPDLSTRGSATRPEVSRHR